MATRINNRNRSLYPAFRRRLIADAVFATIEPLEGRLCLSASTLSTYQPAVSTNVAGTPTAITTDDFNADGNEDISVANGATNSVNVMLGNGDGTFAAPVTYAVGADPTSIATSDFNGDGAEDIVTADAGSGDISILLGNVDSDSNATGTFGVATNIHVEASGQGAMSVTVDDTNNDGNSDIIVAGPGGLYELLGNGDGTFQAPVKLSSDSFAGVVTGEFDSTGNVDIAATNPTAGTVEIFAGNGDGTFAAATSVSVAPGVSGIATSDFNGDGVSDLVVTVPGKNQVDVLLGNSTTVTTQTPTPTPTPITPTRILPTPILPISTPITITSKDPIPTTALVTSVNGGTGSLVGASSSGTSSGYGYTTGNGTFAAAIPITVSGTPTSVTVDNIDSNYNSDIVLSNATSNSVTIIPGNGDGTFGTPVDVRMGASPAAVVSDDFSGTGGSDLATANSNGTVAVAQEQSCNVGVTLTANSSHVALGSNITYTITVTNSGPGPATNTSIDDFLPSGVTFVSATSSQGTVDTSNSGGSTIGVDPPVNVGTPVPLAAGYDTGLVSTVLSSSGGSSSRTYTTPGDITANLGTLVSGATATITIVVTPKIYGTATDSVSVSTDSLQSSYNNTYATLDTHVVGASGSEVSITAQPGAFWVKTGDNVTYSFNITNDGPDTATGLSFTDTLPAGTAYVSSSTSLGTVTGTSDSSVTASLGDLAVDASATVTVTIKASTTAGDITDTATVATTSADPDSADNTASVTTAVGDFGGPIPYEPILAYGGAASNGGALTTLAAGVPVPTSTPTPAPTATSKLSSIGLPTISISNVKQVDGLKGTSNFVFTVTRAGNTSSAVSLHYQTVDGTAKAGVAYMPASGVLSLASGVSSTTVTVPVIGTKKYTPNESFVVQLAGAKNAVLKHSRATGVIVSAAKPVAKPIPKPKPAPNPAAHPVKINFEPTGGQAVTGYLQDTGLAFGVRTGTLSYGWSSDNTANAVFRTGVKNPVQATSILLGTPAVTSWSIAVPNGKYNVQVFAGDSTITSGTDSVDANGALVLSGKLKNKHTFLTGSHVIKVTNGMLTLTDGGATKVPLDAVSVHYVGA